jgi:hypothetical protein
MQSLTDFKATEEFGKHLALLPAEFESATVLTPDAWRGGKAEYNS